MQTEPSRHLRELMTLVKVARTYIKGCASGVHISFGRRVKMNRQGCTNAHTHTHTIICLLHFLITVTIGGPPVRIYLLPLLPPIHLPPLPRSLTPLLPGSQATIGPDSPLTLLQRQDKRNFSRKENIWPPPHTKQTLYIMVSICVCVCFCGCEESEDY